MNYTFQIQKIFKGSLQWSRAVSTGKRFLAYRSQSTSPAQQLQQARGFGKYFIRYNRRVSFDDVLAVLSWITLSGGAFFVFKTTTAVSLILQATELTGAKSLLISELNKQLDNSRVQEQSLFSFLKNNSSINVNIGDITTSITTTASDASSNSQDSEGERVLTLHNVHIIRDKSTIEQHSSNEDNSDALNVAYYDVTIDRIDFSLDFVRWIDGKGLIRTLDVDGVNGTVNKRHVVYPPPDPSIAALSVEEDLMQDLATKGQQLMGSHSKTCLDSFKMSNLHLDILDVQNFRPYSIQLDYIDCSEGGLRLQWFVPDLMSASALMCTYDGAAISLDRIQYQKQEQNQQIADTSEWIQHLRVTGLNVDMVNWNSKPPLNWITQGFVDFDIYCHIPDYNSLSTDDIVQSLQDEQLQGSVNQAPAPIVTDQFNISVITMTQDVPPSTQVDQQPQDDASLQDQVDQMTKDISDRVSQTYRQYLIDQLYSMIVKQAQITYGKQEVDDTVSDSSGPRDEEDFTSFGSAVELIELNDIPGDSQQTAAPNGADLNGDQSEIGGDKLQRLLRPSLNSNCSFVVSAHVRDLEVRVSEVLLLNGRKISPAWTKSMMNYVNSYSTITEQNATSTNGVDNGGGDDSNGQTPRRRLHVEFEHPYLHFFSAWNIYDSKLATILNKKFSERFGEIVSEWLSELIRRRSVDRGLTKSIKGDLGNGITNNISDGSKDAQSINFQTRAWWNWGWFQQKPQLQQGQDYLAQGSSQQDANDTNIRRQLEMQSNGELLLNLIRLRARAIAPAAPQMFTKSFDHHYSMQFDYQAADWFDFQE
ncbi:hypothetical protein MIR68_012095 [Amoeboaphelidium protococcarum]|nr:hypothetical protein MIR68_012095 [Amoeboaphelidium protococcarum]